MRPATQLLVRELHACALSGMTREHAAEKFGMAYGSIVRLALSGGVRFRHKTKEADDPRAPQMAALYQAGHTLQQIGDQFNITRERVRQILRDRTTVTREQGGQAVRAAERRAERRAAFNDACLQKYGFGADELRRVKAVAREMRAAGAGPYQVPLYAFQLQRRNAASREIGWELTFAQWWSIWESSGKWGQRGRGQGYVMCRHGDCGPYTLGNVFIAPARENSSKRKGKKSGLPMGVQKSGKKFIAVRHINGTAHRTPRLPSPELAYAAYLALAPASSEAA